MTLVIIWTLAVAAWLIRQYVTGELAPPDGDCYPEDDAE